MGRRGQEAAAPCRLSLPARRALEIWSLDTFFVTRKKPGPPLAHTKLNVTGKGGGAMHSMDELYRAHSRALHAHCVSMLSNVAQARDAVHDTFERVMRARARALFDEARVVPY